MKTLTAEHERVGYAASTDTLYVGYGDYSPDLCTDVDEISPTVTVLYGWPDGGFVGVEVYDFKKTYGSLPLSLLIEADEPFMLEIPDFAK